MCALCEKGTIEGMNGPRKEKCIIFLNGFLLYFLFWSKKYFDTCFDHFIKLIASHHY